jgi:type II secretory pathway pseudopilin PulG
MSAVRREDGFTLIELLVSMVLSMVILSAVILLFVSYDQHTHYDDQRIDAQNEGRLAVDRIVRQLRNVASPITTPRLLERATAYDIVFQTVGSPSGSNTAGVERVRYCIPSDSTGSASNEYLYAETQTWSTSTPASDPWSSDPAQTISCLDISVGQNKTCPNAAGGTCGATAIAYGVVNRYKGDTSGNEAFTFVTGTAPNTTSSTSITDPTSTQTPISSVEINLFVNPNTSLLKTQPYLKTLPGVFQIQSSVFLRNQQLSPVAKFTPTPTGSGNLVLNGGASYSPDGDDLSYSWSCTDPSSSPSCSSLSKLSGGLVSWSPGAGTYTVQLTVTDSTGLTDISDPQTVIVT